MTLSIIIASILVIAACVFGWIVKPYLDKYAVVQVSEEEKVFLAPESSHVLIVNSDEVPEEGPQYVPQETVSDDPDEGNEIIKGITEEDAETIQEELMKDTVKPKKKYYHKKKYQKSDNEDKPKTKRGRPKKKSTEDKA